MLGGCASAPPGSAGRDGPEASPPPGLVQVPDAEPRVEPIRAGGPNKPYDVAGHSYVPITQDAPFTERGPASWYGRKFHGRRTASGELYNMYGMTAAHPTLPIPSYARIRNPANGREVLVRINDRGPFHSNRIVDLSYTAALKLDLLRGVAPVELERITFDDIRTGAWKRESSEATRVASTDARDARYAPPAVTAQANVPVPVPATSVEPVLATTAASSAAMPMTTPMPTPIPAPASSPSAVDKPVADAAPARAFTEPARGFWVQLGAFRERGGAEGFQRRVAAEADWLSPLLAVFTDTALFRLQAGPYPSRDEARSAAERVREALQLVPLIVERR